MDLKPGDRVTNEDMPPGRPVMTVVAVEGKQAKCVWEDGGFAKSNTFRTDRLKPFAGEEAEGAAAAAKVGDVVTSSLDPDQKRMTLKSLEKNMATCEWLEGDTPQTGEFPYETLKVQPKE